MTILADYKTIGFELLRKDVFGEEMDWTEDVGDFLSFGLWDVLVRKREPNQWDDEIRYINKMQESLHHPEKFEPSWIK